MELFDLSLKIAPPVGAILEYLAHLLQEFPLPNRDLLDVDAVLLRRKWRSSWSLVVAYCVSLLS